MIKKLKNHPYAQCTIHIHDNQIRFWSYDTCVLIIDIMGDNIKINCTGLYSKTTRRQISWFTHEYFKTISYHTIKFIVETSTPLLALRKELKS